MHKVSIGRIGMMSNWVGVNSDRKKRISRNHCKSHVIIFGCLGDKEVPVIRKAVSYLKRIWITTDKDSTYRCSADIKECGLALTG